MKSISRARLAPRYARNSIPAVFEDPYPVEWTGRQAAVTLPEHIDVSNAGQIREQMLSVINRGATALIVNMTATASCDQSGAEAVARAYQRAVASGTQVRVVVTTPIVRRVLSINGLDRLIPMYPSLEAAAAADRAPTAAVP
jgi:anti-anti-sigma factor